MEHENLQETKWQDAGVIKLENGILTLSSEIPDAPGVYRLHFRDDRYYVGEAGDIKRRLGDYLFYHPSVGIESEQRVHKALTDAGGAEVSVLLGEAFLTRSGRCVREHLEIKLLKSAKKTLLNGGKLEERIAFHESEARRLREKLETQQRLNGAEHE